MTELEQLKQQLEKQEKLASLGMLSAGIAHEIQIPLNFVINFSKMSNKLLDDLTDVVEDNAERLPEADREDLSDIVADLKENMTQIMENGERAVSIIQGILLVSRGKENEFVPTDVCHIVKEYVRLSYHAMRANCQGFNVTLREQYQEGVPHIMVIPQDLSRAVLNVMSMPWESSSQRTTSQSPIEMPSDLTLMSCLVPTAKSDMAASFLERLTVRYWLSF
jgi:signal transduction histidine kinase